jgi:hypothetical protein
MSNPNLMAAFDEKYTYQERVEKEGMAKRLASSGKVVPVSLPIYLFRSLFLCGNHWSSTRHTFDTFS